jgi:hypothetical protein
LHRATGAFGPQSLPFHLSTILSCSLVRKRRASLSLSLMPMCKSRALNLRCDPITDFSSLLSLTPSAPLTLGVIARLARILRHCGFSICQQLLYKLSGISLPEAASSRPSFPWFPEFSTPSTASTASPLNPAGTYPAVDALTLVLACHTLARAEEARKRLIRDFEKRIAARSSRSPRAGAAGSQQCSFPAMFMQRLRIEAVEINMTSTKTMSAFSEYAKDRLVHPST